MELYKISRKDFKDSFKSARAVSLLTGKSIVYHWVDCIMCIIKYGCCPIQYQKDSFYKLRSFDREKTYTKGRGYKIKRLLNESQYLHLVTNKVDFNRCFSDYIMRPWVYGKDTSKEELLDFLKANDRIIVKPINSMEGIGVYELDRTISDAENLRIISGKDILLERFIIQHPMMEYGAKSVNTIRVNTITNTQGNVHIIKACLRCGVGDAIVDNLSAGGVVYPINIEYGRIEGPGVSHQRKDAFFVHPRTNFFMLGREIPFWKELLETVTSAAKKVPHIRFIGWDVAITTSGPELIEGNTRPGASLIENNGVKRGFYKQMMSYR